MRPRRGRAARPLAASSLALALAAVSCEPPEPPPWHEEEGLRWRSLVVRGAGVGFSRVDPGRAGIAFANTLSRDSLLQNEILANGSGVALGDVDGDGRVDLFFAAIEGRSALYRNLGGWRFEEVTERAGVGLVGGSRGAAFADVDGDGDHDLLVSRHALPDRLFLNDGTGAFRDASATSGLTGERAGHTLALADVEGDGDLDLYVSNYKRRWARDEFPPAELAFERVVAVEGERRRIRPPYDEHYRLVDTEEGLQRREFAEPDDFYLNRGDGTFERVPFSAGRFLGEDGALPAREPDDWGLAARFHDLDGDGDPDLYVCNDLSSPDRIWMNDGDGRFRAIPELAVRKTSASSMAVDFSDIDADGHTDFFVAEMLSRDRDRRVRQVPETRLDPTRPGEMENRPQAARNTLQRSRGNATFAEIAYYAGVAASEWTWGALFVDVDLDGYEDLLVANGHALDFLDADAQARANRAARDDDWRRARLAFPALRTRNVAFRNRGDLRFEEAGERWGFGPEEDISHGIAAGDLDGDGDLDVVVTRLDAPPLLLRNESTAPRLAVRLRGRAPNTGAVGARIRVTAAGLPAQQREVAEGGTYLSDSDAAVTFAAGGAERLAIEVRWPDGSRTLVPGARPDRLYEIDETGPAERGGSTAERPGPAGREPGPPPGGRPPTSPAAPDGSPAAPHDSSAAFRAPLFEDRSETLAHRHVEPVFDEFARQPLLPLRLAQLGPGASWYDADADGDPDLLVAAGRGGRIGFFRNDGGSLRPAPVDGPPAEFEETTILGASGAAGSRALLVGRSHYEAEDPRTALEAAAVARREIAPGGRIAGAAGTVLDGARSSTGPLALADVDGDGDLDLFVGGRVIPTAYPHPADSRILRDTGAGVAGDVGADPAAGPPDGQPLTEVGLVSGAAFSDVDADGDPDLWLAVEWGPPRLFRNDGGVFHDVTGEWGLDSLSGRWNGVATGDFDADGRPDAVLTGWGENTEHALDPGPALLFYGDFDRNGVLDPVEAVTRPDGSVVPRRRLGELARGLPFLARRVPDHATYAASTLPELLGSALEGGRRLEARVLSHLLLLNRGGRFEARGLPPAAQLAPAFGATVADFDGDGNEDVFLAQNFFATALRTPRHDAGLGVWLRGDGRGGLDAVPAARSGIAVFGDARAAAAADYDGDGRVDLAVTQNGAETKLYRNVGARPGLRVRLRGPDANPEAIGAALRLVYAEGAGPMREVQAGSGYWSQNDAVQVLGVGGEPVALRVRWPGGRETEVPIPEGAREVVARAPSAPAPGAGGGAAEPDAGPAEGQGTP